jgi:lipopolysaccharide assembly outer membrane protein LptD (OstA)
MNRLLFILGLSIAFLSLAALGKERTPVILNHANTLTSTEENGQRKQQLQGDVSITKDSLYVTCQYADYYPDSGIVIFRDKVTFQTPSRVMFADRVVYNENTEEVNATSNVRVFQHDTLSVTCQSADYFDRLKDGYLYNDVRMHEDNRRLLLTGQRGYIDSEHQSGWVTGQPVATERDSTMRIVSEVHGDTIKYFGESKLVRVVGHVRVDRDSLTATGTELNYLTGEHFAELTGSPEAVRNEDHITGDTIRLFFEKEKEALDSVEVAGHALATSPADSGFAEPLNRMEGKYMTLYMDSSRISSVLIEGTAIATYYIREKGEKRGMNVTSGDRLHVYFEGRKMERIVVEGGTQGTYTPQRLVGKPNT